MATNVPKIMLSGSQLGVQKTMAHLVSAGCSNPWPRPCPRSCCRGASWVSQNHIVGVPAGCPKPCPTPQPTSCCQGTSWVSQDLVVGVPAGCNKPCPRLCLRSCCRAMSLVSQTMLSGISWMSKPMSKAVPTAMLSGYQLGVQNHGQDRPGSCCRSTFGMA